MSTSLGVEPAYDFDIGGDVRFPTPLDRLLFLRTLPTVGSLVGDGLLYIAQHSVERTHKKGALIYAPDKPVESVHFIAEGAIRVEQEGRRLGDYEAGWAVGFLPVLSKSTVGQRAFALGDCVTLELRREPLMEVLEDEFPFLASGIRQLSRQVLEAQRELEVLGELERSEPEDVPMPTRPLDQMDKLALLRRGPFAEVNLEALFQLVDHEREVRFEPGEVLWREGDPSTWGAHIIYGVVACETAERTFRMGPRSVVGHLDAYSGEPRAYSATAETVVICMRGEVANFFDVLEDNFGLAIGFLSFLSKFALDLAVQLARLKDE